MTVGSRVRTTLATLESIEATLSSLAAKTEEEGARDAFHQSALKTRTVIAEIKKRLAQLELEEPQYKQS